MLDLAFLPLANHSVDDRLVETVVDVEAAHPVCGGGARQPGEDRTEDQQGRETARRHLSASFRSRPTRAGRHHSTSRRFHHHLHQHHLPLRHRLLLLLRRRSHDDDVVVVVVVPIEPPTWTPSGTAAEAIEPRSRCRGIDRSWSIDVSPDRYATTPRTLLISSYIPPYIVSTRHYTNLQLTEYRQTSFVIFCLFSLLYRYLVRFFFSFFVSITRSESFFAKLMNVIKQTTRLSVYLVVGLTIFPDLNTDRLFSCHCSKYPRVVSLDRTRSTRSLSDRSVPCFLSLLRSRIDKKTHSSAHFIREAI